MKNEIRITPSNLSVREAAQGEGQEGNSRTIVGYAIRFNEESVVLDDWGSRFTEVILPSCVTEEYLRECDIKMTLFHNRESLLARWNKGEGSLRLEVDEQGVKFEFEAPMTDDGERCIQGVERGDLSGCSFTFAPKDYEIVERGKDDILIKHSAFSWLGEMTIGSDPAYPTTSVNCREIAKTLPIAQEEMRMQREAEEKALRARKAAYYGYLND